MDGEGRGPTNQGPQSFLEARATQSLLTRAIIHLLGSELSTFHISTHLTLGVRDYHYLCFADEESEAQRSK